MPRSRSTCLPLSDRRFRTEVRGLCADLIDEAEERDALHVIMPLLIPVLKAIETPASPPLRSGATAPPSRRRSGPNT